MIPRRHHTVDSPLVPGRNVGLNNELSKRQEAEMPALPSGLVTFLCTDIEGSTRRWEVNPDAMRVVLHSISAEEGH